jgi:hypothetical protein
MPAYPLWAHALLIHPDRVARRLERVASCGLVETTPNLWQISLGVLRMLERVLFRSETVGTCREGSVRPNLRARLLQNRALRLPFLLAERAVAPLDFSGLTSSPERVIRHLLGAHHDRNQFAYDLQMLAAEPGALDALAVRVREVVASDGPRARWLRDLTVFEGYHESLLAAVTRACEGDFELPPGDADDPDISFFAYLAWCAAQPETPQATLEAILAGRFQLQRGIERDIGRGSGRGSGRGLERDPRRAEVAC